MDIKIIWVGRTKNSSIRTLSHDYLERIRHWIPCNIIEIRDLPKGRKRTGRNLLTMAEVDIQKRLSADSRVVVLDEKGVELASPQLARWLQEEQNRGRREVIFVIGGPDGLSPTICERADLRLSLGKMTWPHEICQLLVLEQLYRALSILRNIPYHK